MYARQGFQARRFWAEAGKQPTPSSLPAGRNKLKLELQLPKGRDAARGSASLLCDRPVGTASQSSGPRRIAGLACIQQLKHRTIRQNHSIKQHDMAIRPDDETIRRLRVIRGQLPFDDEDETEEEERVPNVQLSTSNIERPTSNIQHQGRKSGARVARPSRGDRLKPGHRAGTVADRRYRS